MLNRMYVRATESETSRNFSLRYTYMVALFLAWNKKRTNLAYLFRRELATLLPSWSAILKSFANMVGRLLSASICFGGGIYQVNGDDSLAYSRHGGNVFRRFQEESA